MNFTCWPIYLVVCIFTTPCCLCNICVDKYRRTNAAKGQEEIIVKQPNNSIAEVLNK